MRTRLIKKGELILMSEGEYSDYSVAFIAKALKDIDIDIVKQLYLETATNDNGNDDFYDYEFNTNFPAWLIKEGYIVEIQYKEWHYQSYIFNGDNGDFWMIEN